MKTSTFHASKKDVFDAVKKACGLLELSVTNQDLNSGRLKIKHEGSFLSFGNTIIVSIGRRETKTILKVASRSSTLVQLIDWGTNRELEENIIREVKKILSK